MMELAKLAMASENLLEDSVSIIDNNIKTLMSGILHLQ